MAFSKLARDLLAWGGGAPKRLWYQSVTIHGVFSLRTISMGIDGLTVLKSLSKKNDPQPSLESLATYQRNCTLTDAYSLGDVYERILAALKCSGISPAVAEAHFGTRGLPTRQ